MGETIKFANFITKGLEVQKNEYDDRIFTGHITAEIVDRQGEIIAIAEVEKIIKNYMEVNPVLSEIHSNRICGQVLEYSKSTIEGHPSIKIKAKIYKKAGVTLYDNVWNKIVKGEYKGLSMGGASKIREPQITENGQLIFSLKDLELYEIAICPTPANPLAIIDYVNEFAKSNNLSDKMIKDIDGRQIIQCPSIQCSVTKGNNLDVNLDIDNTSQDAAPRALEESDIAHMVQKAEVIEYFTKPFAGYTDFAACKRANSDKGDSDAYCGKIKHETEGKGKAEFEKKNIEANFKPKGDPIKDNMKTAEEIHKFIYGEDEKAKVNQDIHELADKKEKELTRDVKADEKDKGEFVKQLRKLEVKNITINNDITSSIFS